MTPLLHDENVRVGERGAVIIPAAFRKAYQIEEGSLLVAEAREAGILLRLAAVYPIEIYTAERKAEFLLNNTSTPEDYAWAVQQVRQLGLDPAKIPHQPPPRR